jgi:hypothetical protein
VVISEVIMSIRAHPRAICDDSTKMSHALKRLVAKVQIQSYGQNEKHLSDVG